MKAVCCSIAAFPSQEQQFPAMYFSVPNLTIRLDRSLIITNYSCYASYFHAAEPKYCMQYILHCFFCLLNPTMSTNLK